MSQLSSGSLQASIDFVGVNGILLSRERWSHRVAASGLTPPGYAAFVGGCPGSSFSMCGSTVMPGKMFATLDATEVDFLTSDNQEHWTMLVPLELLTEQLGAEYVAELLQTPYFTAGETGAVDRLSTLVVHSIARLHSNSTCAVDQNPLDTLETQLLDAGIACLLGDKSRKTVEAQSTQRAIAFRLALQEIDAERGNITVDELALRSGVSRRSLEIGFKEALAMPPIRYARLVRLNRMHRVLLQASAEKLSVTQAAQDCGFPELGRAAGYYREAFGELPSDTLHRELKTPDLRLADGLS
ncbi:MAG: helix-turn-helix domain-containing protein [Halieaceae bacterium]